MDRKQMAWTGFKGNHIVRRAVEIALAGSHTLTVFGHPENGYRQLKDILGKRLHFTTLCPCGNYGDSWRICWCSVRRIRSHCLRVERSNAGKSDIFVPCETPKIEDFIRVIEPFEMVMKRIDQRYKGDFNPTLNIESERLLDAAIQRLGFTADRVTRTLALSETIARLAGWSYRNVEHVAEAIQYVKRPWHNIIG